MDRYAVIQDNQIVNVILWDGSGAQPPVSGTLMLEADALASNIPYYVQPDPTVKAQAAITANRASITQAQNVAAQADSVANGTGTLTLAQATTIIRQLAQAVAILARNDVQISRELNALIQLALVAYNDSGS